jgi:hypothetical protein
MTKEQYNFVNIRRLLTEGFSDQELRDLCFDVPGFRPVYKDIGAGTSKTEIVAKLLEHAEQKLQVDTLLALAKELNPARYEAHKPYYLTDSTPTLQKQLANTFPHTPPQPPPSVNPQPQRKPLPWAQIVIPETGEVVSGWLLQVLRDPVWQGIAGVVAILAFIVVLYQIGVPALLWPKPTPTSTPTLTPTWTLTPSATPTITYTPTSTPSPTPTPWRLTSANTFTYNDSVWASITSEAASDPDRPNAIKLTFNNPVTNSYCGWGINLGGFDASKKSALSFWIKGEKGGERFGVGIKDFTTQSGNEPKVPPLTASATWQHVSIPLSKFQEIKRQNLSTLEGLSLGFTYDLGSGTIYVDRFVFEP